ncbi:MAG: stage II sporulation protein R [Bacillota bacterium]
MNKKARLLGVLMEVAIISVAVALLAPIIVAGGGVMAYNPSNLVRLHVMAASDSEWDQTIKLKVRDEVLAVAGEYLAGCDSAEDALARIKEHLSVFEERAKVVLAEYGAAQQVRCEVGHYHFPARSYGEITLGEGEYAALKVVVGEGNGANWWCVIFPPLCLGELTLVEAAGTPGHEGLKLRFASLEWLGRIRAGLTTTAEWVQGALTLK